MEQHQEEVCREIAASPSVLQLGRKKGICPKAGYEKGCVCGKEQGATEKQMKTFLEGGTRECIALRAKRVSLGSQQCRRASCKLSHTTLLVCLHSDLSSVLKIRRH